MILFQKCLVTNLNSVPLYSCIVMQDRMIHSIHSLLPHVSLDSLVRLYEICYPICEINDCIRDCLPELSTCDIHKKNPCLYVFQHGKKIGHTCGVHSCKKHVGIIQCNQDSCFRSCDAGESICMFHKKEEDNKIKAYLPQFSIRIHSSGEYVIKDTLIAYDPIRNQIQGTLVQKEEKWEIDFHRTEQINGLCQRYGIQPTVDMVDLNI